MGERGKETKPKCFLCKHGYYLSYGKCKELHANQLNTMSEGCAEDASATDCKRCRIGYYKNFLRFSDPQNPAPQCLPIPGFHCAEKLDDGCKCDPHAKQMDEDGNKQCLILDPHDYELNTFGVTTGMHAPLRVMQNRQNYNEMCYKEKALNVLFCNNTGLGDSVAGWYLNRDNFQTLKDAVDDCKEQEDTGDKCVYQTAMYEEIHEVRQEIRAWLQFGINDTWWNDRKQCQRFREVTYNVVPTVPDLDDPAAAPTPGE